MIRSWPPTLRIRVLVAFATLLLVQTGCRRSSPESRSDEVIQAASVFTADEQGHSISAADPKSGEVVITSVGIAPHNVQASSDGQMIFAVGAVMGAGQGMDAAMKGRGRLLVLKSASISNGPIATIEVGRQPAHVIIDGLRERAFVTNAGDGTVSVIDVKQGTTKKDVVVGRAPHGLRMSPDGQSIYVANTADGTVSFINVNDLTVSATIPVGKGPVQVAVTPDGNFVYVSLRDENSVAVIDEENRKVVAKIAVGAGPIQVFASPDGREIYAANQGTKAAPGNTLSVIDTASQTVVAEIITGAGAHGVTVSNAGDMIYVANSFADTVSVIDRSSRTVVRTIQVGAGPGGITFAPDP